jgi:ABC-2 type transport system ATP-binding protein
MRSIGSGLAEFADNRVGTFSRGMRQRLGLAEILMKGAQIAILDEPTSGLDPHATAELLGIIRGFKAEGVSVLLSSHCSSGCRAFATASRCSAAAASR